MPSLFKRSNGFYYICYEQDGKRKWKSTGKIHKAEAYKEMMQFENHLKIYRIRTTLQQSLQRALAFLAFPHFNLKTSRTIITQDPVL